MNLAEAANLVLTLQLRDQISSGLDSINRKMGGLNQSSGTLRGGLTKIGTGIGTGIRNSAKIGVIGLGLLTDQVGRGIDSLAELEDVTAQTRAVIESTGGVAGLTADDIRDMSEAFEDSTAIDDKVIEKGADLLLTFTNVGKEGFQPAMQAALDMSVAMDQDLQTSILQIGKALNDPEKGLGALTRVGVNFDEATKKIIQNMIDTGDTAGAQQLIIQELNKEFGGSATAAADTYRGTQEKLKDAVEELQMALAEALLPAIKKVSEKLREFLKDPDVKDGIKKLGESIAGLFSDENIKTGGDALKGIFTFLKELPWTQIKDGLSFAAENAKKVVDVFRSLPPGVQAGLLTFLAANKLSGNMLSAGLGELVKVALSSLRTITAVNVTVVGANVISPGGGGVPIPPAGPVAATPVALIPGAAAVVAGGVAAGVAATMLYEFLRLGNAGTTEEKELIRQIDIKQGELTNLQRYANSQTGPQQEALRGKIGDLESQLMLLRAGENIPAITQALQTVHLDTALAALRLQSGNTLSQTATSQLADIRASSLEQKGLGLHANQIAYDANERLSAIQHSSATTAGKDFSVDVTVKSTLNVSAREVVAAVNHYRVLHGALEY